VWGVVTFYTMYHRHPTGKHILMVCTNVSCMLRGGYDVLHALEKRLGIQAGQTSADGEFTIVEEECLAACADAPCLIAGERYYLRLTPEAAVRALDEIKLMPPDHGHSNGHGSR
jgi:NADH:ubiquinone oxidoreductase subunit E